MTIAILSWGSRETLVNTLESYRNYNLNDSQRLIYFQEITQEDKNIATLYGYSYLGTSENIGIAGGYKALVEAAKDEHILFLENDWELLSPAASQIEAGIELLHFNIANIVRFRHRNNPGWPLWTVQFKDHEWDKMTHLLDAVHWTDPAAKFPDIIRKVGVALPNQENQIFFVTLSKYANWTNNPHLAKVEFLKEHILPRLEGNIEHSLQGWWEQQEFSVAQGDGLFTHHRID